MTDEEHFEQYIFVETMYFLTGRMLEKKFSYMLTFLAAHVDVFPTK